MSLKTKIIIAIAVISFCAGYFIAMKYLALKIYERGINDALDVVGSKSNESMQRNDSIYNPNIDYERGK